MSEKNEKALAVTGGSKLAVRDYTSEEIIHIKNLYAKGATDFEFRMYLLLCQHRGLDPFKGQMFLIPFKDHATGETKRVPVVGFYGLIAIARESGSYAGLTAPEWMDAKGDWHDVWDFDVNPRACRVGAYIKGVEHPTIVVGTWREYAKVDKHGNPQNLWKTRGAFMLYKCTAALAVRITNPDLGGLHISEEFGHAGVEDLDHSPEAASPQNENQVKARATAQGKYSDADICNFGKKHKGQKWCEIEPEYFDWILSNVDDNPDVIDRVKWEINKRAGNLEPENGDIQDVTFEDDGPQNEEDERKVLNATIRASKDILPDATFQQLCGAIAKAQDVKHLSDVDTPGLREMDKLLTEAVNKQLEDDDGET